MMQEAIIIHVVITCSLCLSAANLPTSSSIIFSWVNKSCLISSPHSVPSHTDSALLFSPNLSLVSFFSFYLKQSSEHLYNLHAFLGNFELYGQYTVWQTAGVKDNIKRSQFALDKTDGRLDLLQFLRFYWLLTSMMEQNYLADGSFKERILVGIKLSRYLVFCDLAVIKYLLPC